MHGGDIYNNDVELDFSVNINPLGVPKAVEDAMVGAVGNIQYYPDIRCWELRKKIGEGFNISGNNVICGNGASELIFGICNGIKPKKALLVAPGFSGYIKALNQIEAQIEYYYLREENDFNVQRDILDKIQEVRPDITFITSPHNPTGQLITNVRDIAECSKVNGGILVIDECFIELSLSGGKDTFVNSLEEFDNVIILRAFTKSFAVPGVRLGYVMCSNYDVINKINKALPEWNVSVIAKEAGMAALDLKGYLDKSREVIKTEGTYLKKSLEALGIKVYPFDANFMLIKYDKKDLYGEMLERKILIRDCSDYVGLRKGFYRIAVRNREENERLLKAIQDLER